MKKQLLSLIMILAIGFSLNAQTFTLSNGEGPLADGADVFVYGDTSLTMESHVYIHNQSGANLNVSVMKVETNVLSGTQNMFCFAGQCYGPSTIVSPNSANMGSGGHDSTFIGEYKPKGQLGTSIITYVFFNADTPGDSVRIHVHYAGTGVGINSNELRAEFSNAYPNPANNFVNFNYNIPQGEAYLVIRDLLGSQVAKVRLNNGEGNVRVETGNLINGVYFYSLILNEKNKLTKKFIIKH